MARKAKWTKGKSPFEIHQKDQAVIAKLEEQITRLTQANTENGKAFEETLNRRNEEIVALRKQVQVDQDTIRGMDQKLEKAKTPPATVRRVVRTLTYSGDPVWIAQTLARSLAPGVTVVEGLGGITVTEVSDETHQVRRQELKARG